MSQSEETLLSSLLKALMIPQVKKLKFLHGITFNRKDQFSLVGNRSFLVAN